MNICKFSKFRRIFGKVFPFIVVIAFCLSCALIAGPIPTDEKLETIFFENRKDFETLVRMAEEDDKVYRIAHAFTWVEEQKNSGETGVDRPIGFSRERWDEYRALFKKLQISAGILRSNETNEVWFLAYTRGLATGGLTKGYIFSTKDLDCQTGNLDDLETLPQKPFLCKKIADNWYITLTRGG